MLSPTEIVEFKNFSRLLSDFPVLFKADLNFKDFSRKPSKFKYFQACGNLLEYGAYQVGFNFFIKPFHCDGLSHTYRHIFTISME